MTADRKERDSSAGGQERERETKRQSAAAGAASQQSSGTGKEARTREREQPMTTVREGSEVRARGSIEDNARIAERIPDLWNDRDFDGLMRIAAENMECVAVPFGATYRGPNGYREFMQAWATAFPDGRVEVTRVIADENGAVVEYTGRGTHSGPLSGPFGTIPPTGQRAELLLCDVMEVEQGRVRRIRSYFDNATLMRQLGITPQAGTREATTTSRGGT